MTNGDRNASSSPRTPRRPTAGGGRRPPPAGAGSGTRRPSTRGTTPRRSDARTLPGRRPITGLAFVRGVQAVGGSPALLATAFAGNLVLWLLFAPRVWLPWGAVGGQVSAVSALHSWLDLTLLRQTSALTSTSTAIAVGIGTLIVRSILTALVLALALEWLGGNRTPTGPLAPAARRAVRSLPALLAVEALTLLATQMLLPLVVLFGLPGVVIGIGGLTYLLVMAPVVAVTEGVGPVRAVRVGLRAVRTPGHAVLVLGYVAGDVLMLELTAPLSRSPVTPSLGIWVLVLAVTFLQTGALAMFAVRWLDVREDVLAAVAAPRPEPDKRPPAPAPATPARRRRKR